MTKSKTNGGKVFETNWRNSYPNNLPIYYLRLVDAVKWGTGTGSRFQAENPYDSLQYRMPFIYLLELKSTKGTGISFNGKKPWEKPENKKSLMIKHNQVKSLMEADLTDGVIAGFILNYRERTMKTKSEHDEVFFVHIKDFLRFAAESDKTSISRDDCKSIGFKIGSIKKKVNYTYDVVGFTTGVPIYYLSKGYINRDSLLQAKKWIEELIQ